MSPGLMARARRVYGSPGLYTGHSRVLYNVNPPWYPKRFIWVNLGPAGVVKGCSSILPGGLLTGV